MRFTGIAVAGDGARRGGGFRLGLVVIAAAEDTTRRRGVRRIAPSGGAMLTS